MVAKITLNTRVSFVEYIHFHKHCGEALILNVNTGAYYGLDEVGTRMWELLVKNGCLAAVIPIMLEEYLFSEEQLTLDLLGLLEELALHELVCIDEE